MKDLNTTISGPSYATLACPDDVPTLNAGLVEKSYIFVIFQGGGGSGPPTPSGSAHAQNPLMNAYADVSIGTRGLKFCLGILNYINGTGILYRGHN